MKKWSLITCIGNHYTRILGVGHYIVAWTTPEIYSRAVRMTNYKGVGSTRKLGIVKQWVGIVQYLCH